MNRWLETAALAGLCAMAAAPFVALFPDPPAFGPAGAAILAGTAILAVIGVAARAEPWRRRHMLTPAAILLGTTIASIGLNAVLAATTMRLPTADLMVRLFGLKGEEVDDAVLYERWVELWLACASVAALLTTGLRRPLRPRPGRTSPASPGTVTRANRGAAALDRRHGPALAYRMRCAGQRTARGASNGRLPTPCRSYHRRHRRSATASSHPVNDGQRQVIESTQNGAVSLPARASVPVAYLATDPEGSAQADTVWVNWSTVLGLLWIGGGFRLFPFYGVRAAFRAGRR